MQLPIIAITMGDPAGVGPEICLKAMADPWTGTVCRPVLVGDRTAVARELAGWDNPPEVRYRTDITQAVYAPGTIEVLDLGVLAGQEYAMGQVDARCGDAAFCYVKKAIELAMAGAADATVTAPLNKEALNLAGHAFAGHTEIYAHFTHTQHYSMMLAHGNLRVLHVSTHVSLREACDRVKTPRVLSVIELAGQTMRQLGMRHPRVAVAGLNPHAGEHGLFGREEIEQIQPAIDLAVQKGIDAVGPIPPDTVFAKLAAGAYDVCVCMYHDQGHIPVKLAGFSWDRDSGKMADVSGVNITLGLPIIRVSVDHGTAFDIAGRHIASPASMLSSIDYAVRFAREKTRRSAGA